MQPFSWMHAVVLWVLDILLATTVSTGLLLALYACMRFLLHFTGHYQLVQWAASRSMPYLETLTIGIFIHH